MVDTLPALLLELVLISLALDPSRQRWILRKGMWDTTVVSMLLPESQEHLEL
jgi:hypothetical protein